MPKKPTPPHPLAGGLDQFQDQVENLALHTFRECQGDVFAAMTLAAASFVKLAKSAQEAGAPAAQTYALMSIDLARAGIIETDAPKPTKGH